MKTFDIPGKTFLLGEYAALFSEPSIILTTTPCFEMHLVKEEGLQGISPISPAGRFWKDLGYQHHGLIFDDPYHGKGGMGASSAAFLGVFYAHCELSGIAFQREMLLSYFMRYATEQGNFLKPSGYDLLAQSERGVVYLSREEKQIEVFSWPFLEMSFILLHTGQKLRTHEHLKTVQWKPWMATLKEKVLQAKKALITKDALLLIDAVNRWQTLLMSAGWVAPHTASLIADIQQQLNPLAIKGCGAMGADVLLLLFKKNETQIVNEWFQAKGLCKLADETQLFIPDILCV